MHDSTTHDDSTGPRPAGERPPTAATPVALAGVDAVSIDRIERLLAEFGDSVRRRLFTPREAAYCRSRADPAQHYAARWAAAEAFRKALGAEAGSVPASAVGVVKRGQRPALALEPPAREALDRRLAAAGAAPGDVATAVSLSHDRTADVAAAQVAVVGIAGGGP